MNKNTGDVFDFPVHAAAEVFPMLNDDDLQELANDITANGLLFPLVVKDGVLIDGRNRRAACKLAGVVPAVQELDDQSPEAFVISANVNRRNLTKGQLAMCVALIHPEPIKHKREIHSLIIKEFNHGFLSSARTILRWSPELVDGVRSGAQPLMNAYEIAVQRKNESKQPAQRLEALRKVDPDMADQVVEDRLSLAMAEAAAQQRRKDKEESERQAMNTALQAFDYLITSLGYFRSENALDAFAELLKKPQTIVEMKRRVPIMKIDEYRAKLTAAPAICKQLLDVLANIKDPK